MTYSSSTIPTGESSAYSGGALCFLAQNLLRTNLNPGGDPKWTIGGLQASTDVTNPLFDIRSLWDTRLTSITTATGSDTTWYVNFELDFQTVDYLVLFVQSIEVDTTITLEFGTTTSFGTSVTPVTQAITTSEVPGRFAFLFPDRYTNVTYCRLILDRTTGATAVAAPRLAELSIGRRRQFSRTLLGPFARDARRAEVRRFRSASGDMSSITHSYGAADQRLTTDFTGDDLFGLDDTATFAGLQADTRFGANPFWIRTHDGGLWHYGYFEDAEMIAQVGASEFNRRRWSFNFVEMAPYAARDGG